MKWIIRYCLTCIFLCVIFLIKAEDFSGVFHFPDSLIKLNSLREASIELERIWFTNSEPEVKTNALIRKAWCYKQMKIWGKSAETLNRIFLFNQPDSIVFRIRYEKALAWYLNKEPGKTVAELQLMQNKFIKPDDTARIHFLMALSQCELKMWEKAKQSARNYLEYYECDTLRLKNALIRLEELFANKNLPKDLSKTRARNYSMFIPGTGQFYAGKLGEGFFSLGLHGALLYFGLHQFVNNYYFTGYTVGFGPLQRLYSGNLQRVQNLVDEVNRKNKDEFLRELVSLLAEN